MNASRLSRIICEGVHLYAKRQDLPVGGTSYQIADEQWTFWAERQTTDVVEVVKALQATAFDIALDLGSGGSASTSLQRQLSKGLA